MGAGRKIYHAASWLSKVCPYTIIPSMPASVPLTKRIFDLLLTIPGLILLSPLCLVLMIIVRWKLGSPVFFKQVRPGLYGKPFALYKFRSMTNQKDAVGNLLPDADRLTSLGRFMRSSSLDELPELINVLRGEMSLIGPRPLLTAYLDRYTPEQARRQDVLPGITGWAQINGRNAISWEQKFQYDVWYVDHQSLGLDIKILVITLWRVLLREGISQPGEATATEFMGSKKP
jgi:sugar transferase EpsL